MAFSSTTKILYITFCMNNFKDDVEVMLKRMKLLTFSNALHSISSVIFPNGSRLYLTVEENNTGS